MTNLKKYRELLETGELVNIQLAYQLFVVGGVVDKVDFLWDVWALDNRFLEKFDKYENETYVHSCLPVQIKYKLSTVCICGKSEVFGLDLRLKKLNLFLYKIDKKELVSLFGSKEAYSMSAVKQEKVIQGAIQKEIMKLVKTLVTVKYRYLLIQKLIG